MHVQACEITLQDIHGLLSRLPSREVNEGEIAHHFQLLHLVVAGVVEHVAQSLFSGGQAQIAHVQIGHAIHDVFVDVRQRFGPVDGDLFAPQQDTRRNELPASFGGGAMVDVLDESVASILRLVRN